MTLAKPLSIVLLYIAGFILFLGGTGTNYVSIDLGQNKSLSRDIGLWRDCTRASNANQAQSSCTDLDLSAVKNQCSALMQTIVADRAFYIITDVLWGFAVIAALVRLGKPDLLAYHTHTRHAYKAIVAFSLVTSIVAWVLVLSLFGGYFCNVRLSDSTANTIGVSGAAGFAGFCLVVIGFTVEIAVDEEHGHADHHDQELDKPAGDVPQNIAAPPAQDDASATPKPADNPLAGDAGTN